MRGKRTIDGGGFGRKLCCMESHCAGNETVKASSLMRIEHGFRAKCEKGCGMQRRVRSPANDLIFLARKGRRFERQHVA